MRKLYKSDTSRVFDGVCGGLGEYLGVDPVIVRLIWVLLALFGGSGILAYLVAMLIIPRRSGLPTEEKTQPARTPIVLGNHFWGIVLIALGALMLLRFMDPLLRVLLSLLPAVAGIILPASILLAGLYLILRKDGGTVSGGLRNIFPQGRRLTRIPERGKVAGVCAGFARCFNVDDNLVRLIWILAAFASMGFVILAYALLAIFLPQSDPLSEEPETAE